MILHLTKGTITDQRAILTRLAELQYTRNEIGFSRGTFRVRGDVIDIFPADSDELAVRVELFDDEVDRIVMFDPLTGSAVMRYHALLSIQKLTMLRQEILWTMR